MSNVTHLPTPIKPTISSSIRVSVGDIHKPFLTLASTKEGYFTFLHEKGCLPNLRQPLKAVGGQQHHGNLVYKKVDEAVWQVILAGIKAHEKVGGWHLNPPSFLTGYCYAKGVDLYKEGILTL